MADGLNLYQRIVKIGGDIKGLKATGKTGMGGKAISIGDVEDLLRPLCAKHGVVMGYRWNAEPKVVEETQRADRSTGEVRGVNRTWQVDLTAWVVNADVPTDRIEDRIIDFGSSPSGAVSFALKRYYRALFHLSEDENGVQRPGPIRQEQPVADPDAPAPKGARPALFAWGTGALGLHETQIRQVVKEVRGQESTEGLTVGQNAEIRRLLERYAKEGFPPVPLMPVGAEPVGTETPENGA